MAGVLRDAPARGEPGEPGRLRLHGLDGGDLDRIAAGEENGTEFLSGFFFGPDGTGENGGLRHDVASLGDDIDARAVNSIDLGRGVTLRVGRYGPYMEKADGTRANVPPEVAPTS